MTRHIILLLASSALGFYAKAQDAEHYQYKASHRLWQSTTISAGLARDSITTIGRSAVSFNYRGGNYHHIQEGTSRQSYSFETEQCRTIGKYIYAYGFAHIKQDKIKQAAWNDLYRPIRSNPYGVGSRVQGDYTEQDFNFSTQLATRPLGRWTLGLGLDYNMGDLSRLRDPRSRVLLLDYKLAPSFTWNFYNQHTLGLAFSYERRKEKLLNISTVQEDPNLTYYFYKGLDEQTNLIGGYKGFSRQWVDETYQLSLAHAASTKNLRSLVHLSLGTSSEAVTEAAKYQPGKYHRTIYTAEWQGLYSGVNSLQTLQIGTKLDAGKADEYLSQEINTQEPETKINSKYWDITYIYKNRFKQDNLSINLRYKYAWVKHSTSSQQAYIGLSSQYNYYKQSYSLPVKRQRADRAEFNLLGGGTLNLNPKSKLNIDASLGYSYSPKNELVGFSTLSNNDYTDAVLSPLQAFYTANLAKMQLILEYQHRLKLGKTYHFGYLRFLSDYYHSSNNLNRYQLALSLGLYH